MNDDPPPPAGGVRPDWAELPPGVRAAVESRLGSPVVDALSQPGGFSPGLAARVRLADGGRAFVKAVGSSPNPETPDMHRAESRVAAVLPATAPAPRLRWSYDDGDWVVLVFDEVDGRHPRQPWDRDELDAVFDALVELGRTLTPSPIRDVPTVAALFEEDFSGWRELAADPPADLPPWETRNLDRLARCERGWVEAAAGDTLLHCDVRADNLLIRPDGSVVLVDWPWACRGAAWVDLVCFLPNVMLYGGPDPEDVLARSPLLSGVEPDAVTAVACALAGMWARSTRRPPPPGLPTLRAFQAAHLRVVTDWLVRRTGWT